MHPLPSSQKADVHKYVAGFTAANDVTARNWEKTRNLGQMFLSKGMDTFCPLGPAIVTVDELPVEGAYRRQRAHLNLSNRV